MRKFYINAAGGTGFNIALASFISYIKENGDDNGNKDYEFYVCSPYYDTFESCPYVTGVYKPNELRDMVLDAQSNGGELVLHRLYDMSDFVFKKLNYSQAWAKLMNIPFTDTEKGTKVKSILEPTKKYPALINMVEGLKKLISDKGFEDYVIMQFTGGQSPLVQVPSEIGKDGKPTGKPDWSKQPYNYDNEPLKRHYPIEKANEFVKLYHEANPKTAIILYQLPNEPSPDYDFVVKATIPYLAYYELAKTAKEVVCIDSSLQHLVAGVTKTTVIWAHSSNDSNKHNGQTYFPFGYSYNKNVIQPCRRDDIWFFTALGACGAKVSYIEPEKLIKIVSDTNSHAIYEEVNGEYTSYDK